jgi:hypothetical protein
MVAVWVIATPLIFPDTTFDPATVELRLPLAAPLELVGAPGCVTAFPVPVAARNDGRPWIAFPNVSLAMI